MLSWLRKTRGKDLTVYPEILEDASALALAAVCVFFIRLSDGTCNIYFREKCPASISSTCVRHEIFSERNYFHIVNLPTSLSVPQIKSGVSEK
jgi:hypothetical protein